MPGRIVKVLVRPGDRVEAGQGLVVVEAMKMENELRAQGRGVVEQIHVAAGDRVEKGAPLVTLR
jgi:biotin carboxyl carrier protein